MTDVATRRRSRGGGGAARRAERTSVKVEAAKFIERNIPTFDILTQEALEIIEANAEKVLEEVGVNFVNNPGALDLWRQAGADINGERVRIPRGLARELCSTAPSRYTQEILWSAHRFMALRLCAMLPAGGVMRRSRIFKNL